MNRKSRGSEKVFDIIIMIILGLLALMFLFPLINVLASSFSSADAVVSGEVGLFPQQFTLDGYKEIFKNEDIWRGFRNSLLYTFIGTIIQVTCQVLCAYPLSRRDFKGRKFLNLFLVLTMFISVFNIIVIRTYMQSSIPMELQEAAMIDGCGDVKIFTRIVLPLCRPIIAVMVLYAIVGYWNSYFNALMYVQDSSLYPLQNVLNSILISNQSSVGGGTDVNLSEQLKYVTIVVSSLPLLIIYPFFQKYFEKGVTIGGIKG